MAQDKKPLSDIELELQAAFEALEAGESLPQQLATPAAHRSFLVGESYSLN